MKNSRLLIPVAAAIAVLVVLGGFWLASNGDDDSEANPGSGGLPAVTPDPSDVPAAGNTMPVGVDSYFLAAPDQLILNYSIGVPECYGKLIEPPTVDQTDDAIVVTLQRFVPKQDTDVACIEIALMKTVTVQLDAPLGKRVVQDGSQDGKPIQAADAPYENTDD